MLIKARQSVNLSLAGCAKPSRSPSTQAQDERKQFHVIELFHSVPAEALEAFLVFSAAARMNSFKTILIPGSVLIDFEMHFLYLFGCISKLTLFVIHRSGWERLFDSGRFL
jgi:hypothetical protein